MLLNRLTPLVLVASMLGCGGTRQIPIPIDLSVVQSPGDSLMGTARQPTDSLLTNRGLRNCLPEADQTDDTPAAEGAFLSDSTLGVWDLPDLPDSLAASTQAQLATAEELFDYPVVVNRRVLTWIDAYLGRIRKTFERSLRRSGRYLPMARRIFAEEGIPQDLAFLAHVESGFRSTARSGKSAGGLWQFIRGTAKLQGLRCDDVIDERFDPESSTRAAARHLRELYERYGDWNLALAAYNAGAGNVDKAIARSGSSDFWQIANTRHLRNETRNFVPAILAATILAKSPGAYGLTEETECPLVYDTLTVRVATDLRVIAEATGLVLEDLTELNPALLRGQTSSKCRTVVRLPLGARELTSQALARIPENQRLVFHQHTVRKGDTLSKLAQRYGTSVRSIQAENGMGRSTTIRVGRVLRIPNRLPQGFARADRMPSAKNVPLDTAPPEFASVGEDNSEPDLGRVPSTVHVVEEARTALGEEVQTPPLDDEAEEVKPRVHVVQRGDTLGRISQRYGVPLSQLYRWNNLSPRSVIRPGQKIITRKR